MASLQPGWNLPLFMPFVGLQKQSAVSEKILKEYIKADGQRRLMVGKIIVKEKVHYAFIIVFHSTKQRPMHHKYVCMANFRTLIATFEMS